MSKVYSPDYALACSALTSIGNHSDDRVNVWHGATVPAYVCGFHAAQLDSRAYATMRSAGTIA
jgi:hypothetical protein